MSTDWFVYLLDCDGTHLYTGITGNVSRRLEDHRSGKAPGAKFTRKFKKIHIAYCVKCAGKRQAQQIECALKKKSRRIKLALIRKCPDLDQLLAAVFP